MFKLSRAIRDGSLSSITKARLNCVFPLESFVSLVLFHLTITTAVHSSNYEYRNGAATSSTESPFAHGSLSPQNYTLRNLEPYSEYLVTLRVFNPQGDGPTTTLIASTEEGGKLICFRCVEPSKLTIDVQYPRHLSTLPYCVWAATVHESNGPNH